MKEKKLPEGLHRDTLAVRTGLPPSQWGENSEALFLTSGFVQPDSETMAHRFANPQEGYTYGRTSNPTVTSFEQRLAAMEGTEAAIGTATGVQVSQATYRTQSAGAGPLERTEIVLPLSGSYGQMRDFLKRSLAEIPVMSLDQPSSVS